eukprot:m.98674 g.98674  ORF g.98674 m.98674 type:complete len:233 (-) comp13126_c0_seq10:68-766(-)
MEAVIVGADIRMFAKAFAGLSKVGENVDIEATPTEIALRTINSSRSGYACATFKKEFFRKFVTPDVSALNADGQPESLQCRVLNKACLSVFKSMASLKKNVEKCRLIIDVQEACLVFELKCRFGIVKTYSLDIEGSECLKADYDVKLCQNALCCPPHVFMECLNNFHTSLSEITCTSTPDFITLSSFHQPGASSKRSVVVLFVFKHNFNQRTPKPAKDTFGVFTVFLYNLCC